MPAQKGPGGKEAVHTEQTLQRTGRTVHAEHEKAWLIVTAGNLCKNRLREKRRTELPLEDYDQLPAMDRETFYLFDAILSLPAPYKTAVYLFYYEGYRSDEIAAMLHERPAAIRTRLSRARKLLKKELGGDFLA